MTTASVHDSQVFDEPLDHDSGVDGNKCSVYAGSAYRSQAQEQRLVDARIDSRICEKGTRGKPLTEEQKQTKRTKSKVRARVEFQLIEAPLLQFKTSTSNSNSNFSVTAHS